LITAQTETQLTQTETQLTQTEAARVQTEQALAQERQQSTEAVAAERQSLALKMLQAGAEIDFVIQVTGFTAAQIRGFRSENQ
jgi:uncharacterized protein YkwD